MSLYIPILSELISVLFPPSCPICSNILSGTDGPICASCIQNLPYVPMGSIDPYEPFGRPISPIEERLASCKQLVRGASWIYYAPHSAESQLLADIKYKGHSKLARQLGRLMAKDFLPTALFSTIDCIVPVPLHPLRKLKRGYNQSERLAQGVSDMVHLPVRELLRARYHISQTSLHGDKRNSNVAGVYYPNPSEPMPIGNTHILLVDDVCTTGATLLNAAKALTDTNPHLRITALTLAITSQH